MTEESYRGADQLAEFTIFGALLRWLVPILLLTSLAVGVVWYTSRSDVPVRTIQSEILVRIGYEYSPVPWSSATETQQINFRADEVIGTEIQFLTAEETIQKALAFAPNPTIGDAADGRYNAVQIESARQKLAVKRLEGSNVILVQVTDAEEAWSIAFSKALLDAYLEGRRKLFSEPEYDKMLADNESAVVAILAGLDGEVLQISRRISETTGYLGEAAGALAASPAQPQLREALARDIRALQIYVAQMKQLSALETALDRIAQVLAAESDPAATTGAGNRVSDALLKEAVESLASDAARLSAISAERETLGKRLDTIQTAQMRKSMRDEASHNMTVMTPPRVLATFQGIDRAQRTMVAGLMALILSSLFFVYIDGVRSRSA